MTTQIQLAYASSVTEVTVTASAALQMKSAVLPGDALNPETWVLTRLDTGIQVLAAAVTKLTTSSVILTCLRPLPLATSSVQLDCASLLDAAGALVTGTSLALQGITESRIATPERAAVSRTGAQRDLLNSPLAGQLSGTLVLANGDYANEEGIPLLKKLIMRRIVTTPGDFAHLPGYGIGLRVKEALPTGELVKLKAAIERQVALEPEVDEVRASLTQAGNELQVSVAVRVKATGQRLQVGMAARIGG